VTLLRSAAFPPGSLPAQFSGKAYQIYVYSLCVFLSLVLLTECHGAQSEVQMPDP
jgi:hypothetical protein